MSDCSPLTREVFVVFCGRQSFGSCFLSSPREKACWLFNPHPHVLHCCLLFVAFRVLFSQCSFGILLVTPKLDVFTRVTAHGYENRGDILHALYNYNTFLPKSHTLCYSQYPHVSTFLHVKDGNLGGENCGGLDIRRVKSFTFSIPLRTKSQHSF